MLPSSQPRPWGWQGYGEGPVLSACKGHSWHLLVCCYPLGHSSEPNHSPPPAESQLFPPVPFLPVSTEDGPSSAPSCPPPLPQKKTVIRTVSSPDGFFGGQASSGKAASAASPRLNVSHSESNVCLREEPPFIHPASLGGRPGAFSSSESLEKSSKGNSYWGSSTGKSTGACGPSRNLQSLSSSQLSVSSQVSSASSLHNLLSNIDSKEGVYGKLGALYAESLRRLVAKCEDCFMREQKNELHFSENNWSLFKLTCNKPCCDSGDAIYYCATCSKDPSTTYAVKVSPQPGGIQAYLHLLDGDMCSISTRCSIQCLVFSACISHW